MLSPWCNCPEIDNVSSRSDSRCSLPMLTAQVTRPVDTASDAARTLSGLLASLLQRKSQKARLSSKQEVAFEASERVLRSLIQAEDDGTLWGPLEPTTQSILPRLARTIKYIGVMHESRRNIEEKAWQTRGFAAKQIADGVWVKEEMPTDGMGSRAEVADAATLLMQIQADASASDALGF